MTEETREDASATETETPHWKSELSGWKETIAFFRDLIIIVAIVIFIRNFIASPFRISGDSMEGNYHNKEYILVDQFSYANFGLFRVGDPVRGDVVILRPHATQGKEYYIKRVIGLPGDKLEFRDGEIYVTPAGKTDAAKLDEAYLSAFNRGRTFLPNDVRTSVFTVPEGQYFVMGDNRNNSSDSRSCFRSCSNGAVGHYLHRSDVVGKVFLALGYFKIFETFSLVRPVGIELAAKPSWVVRPQLMGTVREWKYPELEEIAQ